MRRIFPAMIVVGLVVASAAGQVVRPTLEQFSAQASDLERTLRRTTDPVERKRLAEELEKTKHQMGPFDAAGQRIKCQAMWHDAALETLDGEVKRMVARTSAPSAAPPMMADARLHVRRMAAACLTNGWRIYDGKVKYQVDVFGAYLANNLKTLDSLFESASAWIAREAKSDVSVEGGEARADFEKAKQGIDQMGRAAEAMAEAAPDDEAAPVPLLGEFVQGLQAVREADLAVSERLRKKGKPATGQAEPAHATPVPEPPPMTEQEKDRLARLKESTGRLKGEGWAPVVQSIERFATVVEAGFQVASARPKARELLGQIRQAAALAESLNASKVVYPEYVTVCQNEMSADLALMARPTQRERGTARLAQMWQDDLLRRQIEAANLAPAAAKGIVLAYYKIAQEQSAGGSATASSQRQASTIRSSCQTIADTFEKMSAWPPKDMAPKLVECYQRQAGIFRGEVEQAGAGMTADREKAVAQLASAAGRAGDAELIVRADVVVKAVMKYRPVRAAAMHTQVVRACQELVMRPVQPDVPRQALLALVRPFESLDKFPLPEPEYMRAVNALAGRTYPAAAAMLSQELGVAIDMAGTGDASNLASALGARHLFGLLRIRAMADTCRLDRAGTANLVAFSFPDRVWTPFVRTLDRKMQGMLAYYAKDGRRGGVSPLMAMGMWDAAYGAVVSAQRQTLDAWTEGQAEVDFLIENLERAAVATPTTQTQYAWTTGYHAIEAAVAMDAGLDNVAAYHRGRVDSYAIYLRQTDLDPARPPAAKAK
jgi:hypothetical protein